MPSTIEGIKEKINEAKGQAVAIRAQMGRKRVKEQHGVIAETYPAVFIVKLAPESAMGTMDRACYSYTDILTQDIAVDFLTAGGED